MTETTTAPAAAAPEGEAVLDPWGQQAVVLAKSPTHGGTSATTPPATPARYGPWPANGKKYPLALDYIDTPDAMRYNAWFDNWTPKPGMAAGCKVGEALYATQIYYEKDVDVHPLLQLAAAGLVFGGAWGKAYFEAKKETSPADRDEAARIAAALGTSP